MDRFGSLPEPARNLFRVARLRVGAARLGIERLDVGTTGGSVTFSDSTPVDPGALILLVQKSARALRFDGPKKVRFSGNFAEPEEKFVVAQAQLDALGSAWRAAESDSDQRLADSEKRGGERLSLR